MVDKELENVYIFPNVAALRGGGDGRILQWFCSTLQRAGRSVRGERARSCPLHQWWPRVPSLAGTQQQGPHVEQSSGCSVVIQTRVIHPPHHSRVASI